VTFDIQLHEPAKLPGRTWLRPTIENQSKHLPRTVGSQRFAAASALERGGPHLDARRSTSLCSAKRLPALRYVAPPGLDEIAELNS
jgi:hypothetical protein